MALTNRLLFRVAIFLTLLITGCREGGLSSELQLADKRLAQTIDYFSARRHIVPREFQNRAKDERSIAAFGVYATRVKQVNALSDALLAQIERLQDVARRGELTGKEGEQLYDGIVSYIDQVMQIVQTPDTGQVAVFYTRLQVIGRSFRDEMLFSTGLSSGKVGSALSVRAGWADSHVDGLPASLATLELRILKNDLLRAETALLQDWYAMLIRPEGANISYEPLITMDRSTVKAGEKIYVEVSVFAWQKPTDATITASGKVLEQDQYGRYIHEIIVRDPGHQEFELRIKYAHDGYLPAEMYKKMKYYVKP